jgi:peptide/nickel transport system permease protein
LEKTPPYFPIIGKKRKLFSNHWKTSADDLRFAVEGGPLEVRSVQLRRRMDGLLDSQFFFFLRQVARLDFGTSSSLNQPVTQLLAEGIGPTLALTIPIFTLELALAVSLALLCAFFRDRWPDRLAVVVAVGLMSVNYLVWIVAGQYVLAHRLGWFPVWGFESWRYLLLPVGIGVISGLGSSLRFYRTIMLDEMGKGYVRTAFAKGVSRRGVLFRHVLRNALIPVITNVAITLPYLYTGSLLLESFFGIPGLGYLGVNAVNSADVDVVRAIVLIGSLLYVAVNLLTDVAYAVVDPRVRLE